MRHIVHRKQTFQRGRRIDQTSDRPYAEEKARQNHKTGNKPSKTMGNQHRRISGRSWRRNRRNYRTYEGRYSLIVDILTVDMEFYCIWFGCLCRTEHMVQTLQSKTAVMQKEKEEQNRHHHHLHETRCTRRQWGHASDVICSCSSGTRAKLAVTFVVKVWRPQDIRRSKIF